MVLKNPADDLGMAIIGGVEHNLPIIVSEVFPNSAVARASKVLAPVFQLLRILMFLDLPDPYPLVRCMDPDPPSIIKEK